jgi:transcription antitermination factor NusG
VHALLKEKRLESYCPLNKVRKRWSDRMKTVEEPLFKSYVFARLNEEEQTAARMTAGVINFVYWQGKPAIIPDREIETIRKFLNEYENVVAEPIQLKEHSRVTINQGLFMNHEAEVLKIEGNRVKVVIESIGYSLIASVDKKNLSTLTHK